MIDEGAPEGHRNGKARSQTAAGLRCDGVCMAYALLYMSVKRVFMSGLSVAGDFFLSLQGERIAI